MLNFIFWMLFVIAVAFFWYSKLSTRKLRVTPRGGAREIGMVYRSKPLFRGFMLIPGQNCCRSSQAIVGKVYSVEDRMRLPLPECDAKRCDCDRQVVRERRAQERRFVQERRADICFDLKAKERRIRFGRRSLDNSWSNLYLS